MTYALWEIESGNLVGAYDTENGALDVVRRSIEQYGRQSVSMLVLTREGARRITNVAQGDALAARALAAALSKKPAYA